MDEALEKSVTLVARHAAHAGTLTARLAALCLHVWQVAAAERAQSLTEMRHQPVTYTNCSYVDDRKTHKTG